MSFIAKYVTVQVGNVINLPKYLHDISLPVDRFCHL